MEPVPRAEPSISLPCIPDPFGWGCCLGRWLPTCPQVIEEGGCGGHPGPHALHGQIWACKALLSPEVLPPPPVCGSLGVLAAQGHNLGGLGRKECPISWSEARSPRLQGKILPTSSCFWGLWHPWVVAASLSLPLWSHGLPCVCVSSWCEDAGHWFSPSLTQHHLLLTDHICKYPISKVMFCSSGWI